MKYLGAYTTKQFIFISYLEMYWFPSVAFDAIPDAVYFICALTFYLYLIFRNVLVSFSRV